MFFDPLYRNCLRLVLLKDESYNIYLLTPSQTLRLSVFLLAPALYLSNLTLTKKNVELSQSDPLMSDCQ
jgi:hypothetical protein